jgi:hypothetical protein
MQLVVKLANSSACRAVVLGLCFAIAGMSAQTGCLARQQADSYESGEPTDADFAQHVKELRKKLPATDRFHVCVAKPFVVIGNESPEVVEQRAERTVAWAVKRLKRQYFSKDPGHIINIWLFKDKQSYEKYNEELFGSKPTTPFGYYSSADKALVMNIATGGGTLVHEIVHPFVEANFPKCPSWFNEGLASLYEQSSDNDGKIWGATNWRLADLQQNITDRELPTFKELCSTTNSEFYKSDRGNNYAQARYLCYYLQEHDLLGQFYQDFRAQVDDDPSGYQTLVAVLGDPDMAEFQAQWERYVLALRFP